MFILDQRDNQPHSKHCRYNHVSTLPGKTAQNIWLLHATCSVESVGRNVRKILRFILRHTLINTKHFTQLVLSQHLISLTLCLNLQSAFLSEITTMTVMG